MAVSAMYASPAPPGPPLEIRVGPDGRHASARPKACGPVLQAAVERIGEADGDRVGAGGTQKNASREQQGRARESCRQCHVSSQC